MDKLEQAIDDTIQRAFKVFDPENIKPSLDILLEGWKLLPEPRAESKHSFLLAKYITHVYTNAGDLENATQWAETFLISDHSNRGYGESEFMVGKIAYKQGNMTKAKTMFTVANQKSEGRCFASEDTKYKKVLDAAEIRPTSYPELVNAAEAEFVMGNFRAALSLLFDCTNFNEGLVDGQVQLRKGQCFFELGKMDRAADALTRAYMLEGEDAFRSENTKYFDFLKTRIKL